MLNKIFLNLLTIVIGLIDYSNKRLIIFFFKKKI